MHWWEDVEQYKIKLACRLKMDVLEKTFGLVVVAGDDLDTVGDNDRCSAKAMKRSANHKILRDAQSRLRFDALMHGELTYPL